MHKLTVKLSNHPSPLEPMITANGPIERALDIEDIDDVQEIISKIEKLVETIDSLDKGAVSVEVSNKLRGIILHGTLKNGLFTNGVVCS